jgi:hypothetical protein
MFDMLCQNEYTRMWSANDKEKKELQALAEEDVRPETPTPNGRST